ncbi:hypothetical protein Q7P37_005100 [Cladosporium fusiforme]
MSRRLLVTGATGKQGGALIAALTSMPKHPFEIFAVTRDKTSSGAQRLASKPGVKIIEGNLDNVDAIFSQVPKPLWGLFSVPIMDKGHEREEIQGKALTKAAVAAGVSHIVFTSTDRGGQTASEGNPTSVPHFASKFRIEEDIKAQAAAQNNGQVTYTFLRPVAFFENMPDNFIGRAFASMWRLNGADKPLQLIATSDIGKVAAEAFLSHDSPEYRNAAVSLAGDELSVNDAARIFKEETGQTMPETYSWLGGSIRYMVKDLREMFAWFKKDGFGVEVPQMRKRYPYMKDLRTWLREESAWKKA